MSDTIETPGAEPSGESQTPAFRIICDKPGYESCGVAHPAYAEYPAGRFTWEQFRVLLEQPHLHLIPLKTEPASAAPAVTPPDQTEA